MYLLGGFSLWDVSIIRAIMDFGNWEKRLGELEIIVASLEEKYHMYPTGGYLDNGILIDH